MSTAPSSSRRRVSRSRWYLPTFSVLLGIVMFAAQWIGGHPGGGLESLGIMTTFGALILFGGGAVILAPDRTPAPASKSRR